MLTAPGLPTIRHASVETNDHVMVVPDETMTVQNGMSRGAAPDTIDCQSQESQSQQFSDLSVSSARDADLTPPTSSDGHSQSQSSQASLGRVEEEHERLSVVGQKRTASGAVKQAGGSVPASPTKMQASDHSRQGSLESTSSKISEVRSSLLSPSSSFPLLFFPSPLLSLSSSFFSCTS